MLGHIKFLIYLFFLFNVLCVLCLFYIPLRKVYIHTERMYVTKCSCVFHSLLCSHADLRRIVSSGLTHFICVGCKCFCSFRFLLYICVCIYIYFIYLFIYKQVVNNECRCLNSCSLYHLTCMHLCNQVRSNACVSILCSCVSM